MTQHDLILNYLKAHKDINPMIAFNELGITKLATRIGELKQRGYNILDAWVESVNRFGQDVRFKRYVLIRSKNWSEEEFLNYSRNEFMGKFDVTNEEYESLQKSFQEM